MKYFGGCDVGSTYAKCVILDENGKMVADATVRSKIYPVPIRYDKSSAKLTVLTRQRIYRILSVQDMAEIKCLLQMKIYRKSAVMLWVFM